MRDVILAGGVTRPTLMLHSSDTSKNRRCVLFLILAFIQVSSSWTSFPPLSLFSLFPPILLSVKSLLLFLHHLHCSLLLLHMQLFFSLKTSFLLCQYTFYSSVFFASLLLSIIICWTIYTRPPPVAPVPSSSPSSPS